MRCAALVSLVLLASGASSFTLAPATRPRHQVPTGCSMLAVDEAVVSAANQLAHTTTQLAGVIPGLPGYADESGFASSNTLDGKGGDLFTIGLLTVIFPVAVTIFFVGNFQDPE